jgi:hypothetical protein
MNTQQTNVGYGIKITINWDKPTKIIKQKIFCNTGSSSYFQSANINGIPGGTTTIIGK